MTRKDHVRIAEVFKDNRPGENWDANKRVMWNLLAKNIASALKADNDAFNIELFANACGGLFNI